MDIIKKYFESGMLISIAQYNEFAEMAGLESDDQKENFTVGKIQEEDIVSRLVLPFAMMAKHRSIGADIQIDYLDLQAQVKYLKWFSNSTPGIKNKVTWKAIYKDFHWLFEEIRNGKKGRRAFIIAWSPYCSWRNLLQLGAKAGRHAREINSERIRLFPFLRSSDGTIDKIVMVNSNGVITLDNEASGPPTINYAVIGKQTDIINYVMYY